MSIVAIRILAVVRTADERSGQHGMVNEWLISRSSLSELTLRAGRRPAAGAMARQRRAGAPMRRRWPRWTSGWRRSRPARAPEQVWLLEHPPLYTAGTSAKPEELIEARFPVHQTGRGGQFTYHGPGQRVAYVMLDLNRRKPDVRAFVATLEEWIIRTLAAFNVRGERRDDRIGVWVRRPDKGDGYEDKIAAIGIRVRKWVTLHGIALNVEPELSHFSGIVPCGVSEQRYGVTSLADLGLPVEHGRGRHGAAARVRGAVRADRQRRDGVTPSAAPRTVVAAAQRQLVGAAVAHHRCHRRARA